MPAATGSIVAFGVVTLSLIRAPDPGTPVRLPG